MAKKKTSEPVETLHREILPNGNIKLKSIYGVVDTRNNQWYSKAVCKQTTEHFFIEAPHD